MSTNNALLSIGGLSRVSGIGVETLRNWERRYGFPAPVRLDSGHRRYPSDMVARLRLVRRALELGLKPSFALLADTEEIEAMIRRAETENKKNGVINETEFDEEVTRWLERAEALDAFGFEVLLRRAWSKWGAREFIINLALPFLEKVGDLWFEKTISVAHEHFTSENLSSFLSNQWRPISRQARNGKAVVANLAGDFHHLGIHMAAVFLALSNFEVIFLGPNTPTEDIIIAAQETGVVTTVIGLAQTSDIKKSEQAVSKLRAAIPASITLVVGGNANLREIRGVTIMDSMEDFADFAKSLAEIYRG
jgi:methylmalonyl-CoA mutase cobalamin-binding subunit/DNA-binding transcriptional MerR regulator